MGLFVCIFDCLDNSTRIIPMFRILFFPFTYVILFQKQNEYSRLNISRIKWNFPHKYQKNWRTFDVSNEFAVFVRFSFYFYLIQLGFYFRWMVHPNVRYEKEFFCAVSNHCINMILPFLKCIPTDREPTQFSLGTVYHRENGQN